MYVYYIYLCIYLFVHLYIYIFIFIYLYDSICMYVCVFIYLFMYLLYLFIQCRVVEQPGTPAIPTSSPGSIQRPLTAGSSGSPRIPAASRSSPGEENHNSGHWMETNGKIHGLREESMCNWCLTKLRRSFWIGFREKNHRKAPKNHGRIHGFL